jgi:D-glycero-alpha-D-manno-heptose 1-phosphate guanylyltransferase
MVKTAIILSGGLGTRLRKAVPNLPKPMVPIHNRPFLEHQMDYWIEQGITRFILSVGYLKDIIINHFGNSYKGVTIDYAIENSPLGTGGALLLAAKNLNETFLVINGDTFIEVDLASLYKFHLKNISKWTLAFFRTNEFKRYMLINISPKGEILSLNSHESVESGPANGGVYLIEPSAINFFKVKNDEKISLENQLLPDFIYNGEKIFGKECEGKFIDIGLPEDYNRAGDILPK